MSLQLSPGYFLWMRSMQCRRSRFRHGMVASLATAVPSMAASMSNFCKGNGMRRVRGRQTGLTATCNKPWQLDWGSTQTIMMPDCSGRIWRDALHTAVSVVVNQNHTAPPQRGVLHCLVLDTQRADAAKPPVVLANVIQKVQNDA